MSGKWHIFGHTRNPPIIKTPHKNIAFVRGVAFLPNFCVTYRLEISLKFEFLALFALK